MIIVSDTSSISNHFILGVLIQAKKNGINPSIKPNIEKLIEIGFRLNKQLVEKVLNSLGEE